MKALVTGATGFVGSHLVEALAGRGDDVTALVRSPGKADLLNQLGVRQVRGDLNDKAALAEAVAGRDVIYHVAGITAAHNESEFLRANRDGTRNLVAAAETPSRDRATLGSASARPGSERVLQGQAAENGDP
jgi:nucleoside-diphosphate-sugar epimerase